MLEKKIDCEKCGESYPPGWPHSCETKERDVFSQGIAVDGPVILKNGLPMTPEEIVNHLNKTT